MGGPPAGAGVTEVITTGEPPPAPWDSSVLARASLNWILIWPEALPVMVAEELMALMTSRGSEAGMHTFPSSDRSDTSATPASPPPRRPATCEGTTTPACGLLSESVRASEDLSTSCCSDR